MEGLFLIFSLFVFDIRRGSQKQVYYNNLKNFNNFFKKLEFRHKILSTEVSPIIADIL